VGRAGLRFETLEEKKQIRGKELGSDIVISRQEGERIYHYSTNRLFKEKSLATIGGRKRDVVGREYGPGAHIEGGGHAKLCKRSESRA